MRKLRLKKEKLDQELKKAANSDEIIPQEVSHHEDDGINIFFRNYWDMKKTPQ